MVAQNNDLDLQLPNVAECLELARYRLEYCDLLIADTTIDERRRGIWLARRPHLASEVERFEALVAQQEARHD